MAAHSLPPWLLLFSCTTWTTIDINVALAIKEKYFCDKKVAWGKAKRKNLAVRGQVVSVVLNLRSIFRVCCHVCQIVPLSGLMCGICRPQCVKLLKLVILENCFKNQIHLHFLHLSNNISVSSFPAAILKEHMSQAQRFEFFRCQPNTVKLK